MTFFKKNLFCLNIKLAYWVLFIGLLLNGVCSGQAINTNSGKDFWFGFTETQDLTTASYVVYINTFKTTNGTVSIPGSAWSTNFTAVAGFTTRIVLPSADVVVTSFSGPVNMAVNVVADSNISVFAAIEYSERSDNSCILPVSQLGNQYYLMDYTLCQSFSEFMVVAQGCKDSVEIIPSQNITVGGSHLAGVPYTEVLDPGQVLLVQSNSDLTGSMVRSLNHSETGVIAGANWNCVYCSGTANPFYEELLPQNTWGENFVFLPTSQAQDQCRVMSEQNGTVVTFFTPSGNNVQTLNAGHYYDTTVNYATPVFINATNPISVGRFMRTGSCNNYYVSNPTNKGDPAEVVVDANEQMFLDSITFYVSRTPDIDSTYIQIVTRKADENTVFLDGVNIGAFFNTLVANPTYAYTSLTILPGSHTLISTGQGFLAYTCGLGDLDAMAEAAGVYLKEINISTSVTSPSTCSASDGTATATVNGIPPFAYLWTPSGQTTATATGLSAGVYTVTVTDSDCVPHKASAVVSISGRAGYTATVTDSNPDCLRPLGKSTVYPTGGTPAYTYSWSDGQTNQTATGLSAGTYTCTITDNTGCIYILSTTIVNQPPPAIGIAPYNDSSCGPPNETLHVYGLNTNVYHWAPNSGLSCYSCPSPTATPTATTTYTISGADSNGCTASTTITLTVLGTPKPIIKGKDSICLGYVDTLSVTGGVTYLWSNSATTDTIFLSPASTEVISVKASNGYCPPHDTSFTINVVSPDAAIVASKDSICKGDSSQLMASGGLKYTWSTGSTTTSIWVKPFITTTYTLHASFPGCSDSAMVTIKIIPKIGATISASPDSICKHGITTITATDSGRGQATYKWNTGATTSSITVSDSVNTTYTVTVYGICDSIVKTITIKIISPPSPTIQGTLQKCKGAEDTLTISGGITYKWSNGATTSSINVFDTASSTYTATVFGICDTVNKTITVTVIPPPSPVVTGETSVCIGTPDVLTVSGGTRYLWSNGSTANTYTTANILADSIITVIAFNSFGCPDTAHYPITLSPSPNVTLNPSTLACGGSVLLDANSKGLGPFTYSWSPGGQTSDTITVSPDSVTSYTVVVSNGCLVTKTTTVTPDKPTLTACCDKTILLGDDTFIVAKGSSNEKPYQWDPSVSCLNPLCDSVKVTPTVTTTYTVTMTDSLGCEVQRVVTIIVEERCFDFTVPNVFTPGNPGTLGLDNVFYIKTNNLSSWSILIYDRWGKVMFNSTNPDDSWDGKTKSGGAAPAGVYYYMIDGTCQGNTYKKDGFVQLIR